jgi:hypothetical protein
LFGVGAEGKADVFVFPELEQEELVALVEQLLKTVSAEDYRVIFTDPADTPGEEKPT